MDQNNFGVIMAGGVGSRFWPMSKSDHPKQFIDILGMGQSLLQQTFERIARLCPKDQIYIVTNERYRDLTLKQLPGISPDQVLCEPMRRNTAPCIAYANFKIQSRNPNASIVVTPSDHLIMKEEAFNATISKALTHASKHDQLITIGIKPSRPDTGYGYINYQSSGSDFSKVRSFTEKPDIETARKFLKDGHYAWNSGMFIWSVKSINSSYQQHLPKMFEQFNKIADSFGTDSEQRSIDRLYPNCEDISIDYGIMEKASNVEVITGEFGWSDLGTWGSLYEHLEMDDHNNAIVGDQVFNFNSKGNLVHVPKGKVVVLQGIEDTIVTEHDNMILVCKKDNEQEIKKIVEELGQIPGRKYT